MTMEIDCLYGRYLTGYTMDQSMRMHQRLPGMQQVAGHLPRRRQAARLVQPIARDTSMIAESQYERWNRSRVSSAAMTIAVVMSWTGKRRKDSMSRTACRYVIGSGLLARVAWT